MAVTSWRDAVKILEKGESSVIAITVTDLTSSHSLETFAKALGETKCPLKSLELSALGDGGPKLLTKALRETNIPLKELDLSVSRLGDEGVEYVCKILQNTKFKLQKLVLSGNFISDNGIECVSKYLLRTGPESLAEVDVSENDFGDLGAVHLAKGLKESKGGLLHLDISHNDGITSIGFKAILASLLSRKTPSALKSLRGCVFDEKTQVECGIPPEILKKSITGYEKYASKRLLKWAADVVRKAKAILPEISGYLPVDRVSILVQDYLYWKHPYSFSVFDEVSDVNKGHETVK
eukprot:CAMPEP_0184482768 /NCGR_PEP_ID=MMETSP0113_2-20130426/4353_1 /TAXON_ID=91329 /ORGANISM="Norrisiella sphaerica, Strain BC52" /LENGTH=293 /DNA_ID=CAMNT_0026862713 /DNA_START=118 /DNA_END=999 /DNA_ORIENTATION=-